ncbi:hypothetical protein HPB52_003661 [Rhipicephalus sanguineus]|uniref:Exportin-5 n=1 Tax=Rhipicephalus sanguineus TaxID=34632 RepID=A0A9D4T3S0_RHISA|nr:hypothetical protein HPB52_003661 [Rhipicephalus sanguineus]
MSDVEEACKSVIACVEAAVSPTTTPERRAEAYHAYEDFKEKSPLCAKCGFVLAAKGNHAVVRHIGLQLVEHCIKFRWNVMAIDDKHFIKDNVMKMMAEGTDHLLVEQAHIKDALAKLLVEMIKREWPQQWPQLMKELNDLAVIGETQKELVLLTFLRLAEDVVDLQTVEGARRRDLYQALVKERRDICGFFVRTLETHYGRYRDLLSLHRQLTETTLLSMAGFIEWTPLKEVMESDGLLPRIFCYLLSDRDLRIQAAECLLQVLGQKPKKDEQKLVLALFNQDTLNAIASALTSASSEPLNEASFLFMKKLCSITASLGQNCVTHWSLEPERPSMELFAVYLDFLLSLMQHPSQAINGITLPVWASLFRHSEVSHLDIVRNLLPKFFKVATEKLSKVGYPSRNDSPACAYARLDFDSDDDFAPFLGKFRGDLTEAIRLATLLNPIAGFQMVSQWLQTLLVAKIEVGNEPDNGHCSLNSPSSVRWDALATFMDGVFSRFLSSPNPKPSAEEGIFLLESLLNFETEDPVIQSYALSCISSLGIFLTLAPGSLPNVLNKPCFDQIYSSVKRIQAQDKLITQLEACTLIEALLLLSNEFNNYERQCKFIVEVVSPATAILARNEMKVVASSPEAFMSFIGLTEAPVEATADDSSGYNRSQLLHCVNIFMALIKRCKWPDDIEVAKRGGFYCEGSQTYHSAYCRNAATPYVVSLLPIMAQLLRTYNHFWSPEMRARVHPAFVPALDIHDSEKNSILGVRADGEASESLGSKQPIDRAKSFMCTFQDYCVDYETEMTEEQELLDDQLNRLLSREYLDVLAAILLTKRGQPDASLNSMNEDQEGKQVDSSAATISAFGATVLKTEMFENGFVRDEGSAAYLLRCVLMGLQVLGEHDINQTLLVSLGLAVYQAARPLFPGLCTTLLQIPGCTPEALEPTTMTGSNTVLLSANFRNINMQAFETQLHPPGDGKALPEKKKKEIFKRLISPIIGKNIGQQFKAAIQIMNLPPMFRPQKMAVEEDAVACTDLPNLFEQQ